MLIWDCINASALTEFSISILFCTFELFLHKQHLKDRIIAITTPYAAHKSKISVGRTDIVHMEYQLFGSLLES